MSVSHPFEVVCLDMDGTMLNNEHKISERTGKVLQELSSRGVLIAIATGRSFSSVIEYLAPIGLSQKMIPVICFNGSVCRLVDTETWETSVLFQDLVPEDSFLELLSLTKKVDEMNQESKPVYSTLAAAMTAADEAVKSAGGEAHVGLGDPLAPIDALVQHYNGNNGEVSVETPVTQIHRELIDKYAELVGKKQNVVHSLEQFLEPGNQILPVKCLVLTPEPDRFLALCDRKVEDGGMHPESFHYFRGSPHAFFVEFLKPGATKGSAIVKLAEHLKLDVSTFIAFGDGENDAEMLEAAGRGVAMLNGRPKAKEWGDEITEFTNQDDGVARYLEKEFGL